ncbi:MAG: S8 family serine peptidase [bacterium]|nr:S8 family serine peptidase [bacterium]
MIRKKLFITLFSLVIIISLVLTVNIMAFSDFSTGKANNDNQAKYAPDRVIVKFKADKEPFRVIAVPEGKVMEKVKEYQTRPDVVYVEPDYYVYPLGSNDTAYTNQWALNNIAQTIYKGSGNPDSPINSSKLIGAGTNDADVDWDEAWSEFSNYNWATTVIAIVDSGIDETHLDLKSKIWINELEIAGNKKDDDGNGFIDDTWGWNFAKRNNKPHDGYGHGTHVSGIAAAVTNNGKGIAGVAFPDNIKIMVVKVLSDSGIGFTSDEAKGIRYAVDNGAKVINLSLGSGDSQTIRDAVNYAWGKGVLIVAAAGNNNGGAVIYPAAYENVIAVSATNYKDDIASFSSVGPQVDVAAPGENIFSTFPSYKFYIGTVNGRARHYDVGSGTSMAAPQVAGLAGLLFAQDATRDKNAVRNIIEATASDLGTLGQDNYFGYGRINVYNALLYPTP